MIFLVDYVVVMAEANLFYYDHFQLISFLMVITLVVVFVVVVVPVGVSD